MVNVKPASLCLYSDVQSHMRCVKYDLVCDVNAIEYTKAVVVPIQSITKLFLSF